MKIIKNEKLITRYGKIGNWTFLGALAVLGSGVYISFTRTDLFIYSIAALLLGFTLTQISLYLGSRYSRSPRPDEKLDAGLKGLQNEYVIYHYLTPASHLLVGPAGIWALHPYHQRGRVTYQKDRWRMGGGGFLQGYLRVFGQDGIGRPDLEIQSEINAVKKYLAKQLGESEIPEINAILVFTDDAVEIDVEGAPFPTMNIKQIKGFFRSKGKEKVLSQDYLARVKAALPE